MGVSFCLNAAAEWKSILLEASKGALIQALLERLCLTRKVNCLAGGAQRCARACGPVR